MELYSDGQLTVSEIRICKYYLEAINNLDEKQSLK
jgi:hypothetical protein